MKEIEKTGLIHLVTCLGYSYENTLGLTDRGFWDASRYTSGVCVLTRCMC